MKGLIHFQPLRLSDVDVVKATLASSGTVYASQPLHVANSNGYAALACTFYSGTALVNFSYQLSLDGQNWYAASTSDGTTLTAISNIASSVTASQYIAFTPKPAEWMRVLVTVTSAGNWTMYYTHQEYGH